MSSISTPISQDNDAALEQIIDKLTAFEMNEDSNEQSLPEDLSLLSL